MAEATEISWTDRTWSPWFGCTKVSPACGGCYAEALMDLRYGKVTWGPHGKRVRSSTAYWRNPRKWNREAEAAGRRISVFPSLCDPFDNRADPAVRAEWFALMRETPHLLWLLLTKRPQNIVAMCEAAGSLPDNAALGTTCEDRKRVEINLSALRDAEDHLRRDGRPTFTFASFEPLLEDVGDLTPWLYGPVPLGWAITGGETHQSQHRARPSDPAWFRSIRDQCCKAFVPYHHKQNGEWAPGELVERRSGMVDVALWFDGAWSFEREDLSRTDGHVDDEPHVYRIGKKAAGRLLDGRTWDEMPEVRR